MIRAIADGRCLVEGSPGYDQARTVWNAMVDRRPRAIVRCASADHVADAIRHGCERDLEIGVRCGGHSVLEFAERLGVAEAVVKRRVGNMFIGLGVCDAPRRSPSKCPSTAARSRP